MIRSRMVQVPAVLLTLTTPAFPRMALDSPASVVWHAPTRAWFVSSAGVSPAGARPGGVISRLDARDKQAEPYWITGLRAPRGMAIVDDRLYVADGTEVVVVDIGARAVERTVKVPKARLLHGVAADRTGNVYLSDSLGNTIYRLPPQGPLEVFVPSGRLQGPTGVAVQGSDLIVATSGGKADPAMPAARRGGRLVRVSLASRVVTAIGDRPIGSLDGLVVTDDAYLVTDRLAGTLLRISPAGEATVVRRGLRGPGGIGWDPRQRIVAVPEGDAKDVVFIPVS